MDGDDRPKADRFIIAKDHLFMVAVLTNQLKGAQMNSNSKGQSCGTAKHKKCFG